MKIIREDVKLVAFGDVPVGGVFIDTEEDNVYMKIPKVYEVETDGAGQERHYLYDVICLSNGQPYLFVDGDMVKPCRDAYLTVK